jgi:hypothetical protein
VEELFYAVLEIVIWWGWTIFRKNPNVGLASKIYGE